MAKKGNIHNIRDIFPNTNLLEGASIVRSDDDGTFKIDGFTIIKSGVSENGNFYSPATLRKAATGKVFEGKTIRTDHPDARPHSVKDIVGRIEKTWFNEETKSLKGSGFLSSTADDMVTKVKEGLIGDLSINARGKTVIERDPGTKTLRRNVQEIVKGFSVDLVCEAAAGGTLHEEHQRHKQLCERMKKRMDELEKLTLEELKEARPDLVEKITEEAVKTKPTETKTETKTETPPADVKTLVTEAVSEVFKSRDEAVALATAVQRLSEGITKAIGDVLAECGAADSIKAHVGRALAPYAIETFDTLESIDKKVLSVERDRVLAEFDALVKEHVAPKPAAGIGTGGGGEKKERLVDLIVL